LIPSICYWCRDYFRLVDTECSSIIERPPNPGGIYNVSQMIDVQFDTAMTALGNEPLGLAW